MQIARVGGLVGTFIGLGLSQVVIKRMTSPRTDLEQPILDLVEKNPGIRLPHIQHELGVGLFGRAQLMATLSNLVKQDRLDYEIADNTGPHGERFQYRLPKAPQTPAEVTA